MRGAKTTCIALAAVLAALPAAAEVRLIGRGADGTLSVEIASTPRGPWTPTGSVTEPVLNPTGDLFGDGMPGWDSRGDAVLSAWIRPGEGVLHRAIGVGPGWNGLDGIAADGAHGQPVVDVLDGGWSIAWQQGGLDGVVVVTGTTPRGDAADPLAVAGGVLVGTSASGDMLHVITMEMPSGQLWCTSVLFSFVPTQPIPIQLVVVSQVPLRRLAQLPRGGGSEPQGQGQGKGRESRLSDGLLDADPRLHDVRWPNGSRAALLTWWEDAVLHGVDIGPDGAVLPGRTAPSGKGRSRSGEELIDEMLQAVR